MTKEELTQTAISKIKEYQNSARLLRIDEIQGFREEFVELKRLVGNVALDYEIKSKGLEIERRTLDADNYFKYKQQDKMTDAATNKQCLLDTKDLRYQELEQEKLFKYFRNLYTALEDESNACASRMKIEK